MVGPKSRTSLDSGAADSNSGGRTGVGLNWEGGLGSDVTVDPFFPPPPHTPFSFQW